MKDARSLTVAEMILRLSQQDPEHTVRAYEGEVRGLVIESNGREVAVIEDETSEPVRG
jgi:hypothetical protein